MVCCPNCKSAQIHQSRRKRNCGDGDSHLTFRPALSLRTMRRTLFPSVLDDQPQRFPDRGNVITIPPVRIELTPNKCPFKLFAWRQESL